MSRLSWLKQAAAVPLFRGSSSLLLRALPLSTAIVVGHLHDTVLRGSGWWWRLDAAAGAGDGSSSFLPGDGAGVVKSSRRRFGEDVEAAGDNVLRLGTLLGTNAFL